MLEPGELEPDRLAARTSADLHHPVCRHASSVASSRARQRYSPPGRRSGGGRVPFDERETADQAGILAWLASGQPLFRTEPPDVPPKHLVCYFVPVDEAATSVLLGEHRKAGLWLPPGGHVEDGEDPRQTVLREAGEELDIHATFHPLAGESPFFLTVTPTNETSVTSTSACGS